MGSASKVSLHRHLPLFQVVDVYKILEGDVSGFKCIQMTVGKTRYGIKEMKQTKPKD